MPINKITYQLNEASSYMLEGAVQGFKQQGQLMKRFFNLASQNPGIGITSHYNQLREIRNYYPYNKRKNMGFNMFTELQDNKEVQLAADRFYKKVDELYPRTHKDRMALAYYGLVRSDDKVTLTETKKSAGTLHKATRLEKLKAAINKNYQELKSILVV